MGDEARKLREQADSTRVLYATTEDVNNGVLSEDDVPDVIFTYRVDDATAPSQSPLRRWTLVQYVPRQPHENMDDLRVKARHLLQRKLRKMADQLDPSCPCNSCTVLAIKLDK